MRSKCDIEQTENVVIFDGDCNLCNGVAAWVMKRAKKDTFRFIPFESCEGQLLLERYQFPLDRLDTVIFVKRDIPHTLSDGFIKIIIELPRWRRLAVIVALIPSKWRDAVYRVAAKNRVQWFGSNA